MNFSFASVLMLFTLKNEFTTTRGFTASFTSTFGRFIHDTTTSSSSLYRSNQGWGSYSDSLSNNNDYNDDNSASGNDQELNGQILFNQQEKKQPFTGPSDADGKKDSSYQSLKRKQYVSLSQPQTSSQSTSPPHNLPLNISVIPKNITLPLEYLSDDVDSNVSMNDYQCAYCHEFSLTGEGARLSYLLIVHNDRTLEDAYYAFRAIAAPRTIILIHLDMKLNISAFLESSLYQAIENCRCGAQVSVHQIYDVEWAKWSMNEPTLWAMDILTHHPNFVNRWDVFSNLSGDSMPTLTPKSMSRYFGQNGPFYGSNFVTAASCETGLHPSSISVFSKGWHKRDAYDDDPDIHFNNNRETIKMITHFGSQWVSLTYEFVEYVAHSLRDPDSLASKYRDSLVERHKHITDEVFIPTLLMHTRFNQTLPLVTEEEGALTITGSNISNLRYERMDEHAPSAFGKYPTNQRYEVPESSIADQPNVWGPYFLGLYDIGEIKRSGAPFIRKVSVHVDPNIVHMLPVNDLNDLPNIEWIESPGIKLSAVPDWGKTK